MALIRKGVSTALGALIVGVTAGCASAPPPANQELAAARQVYAQAASGTAAQNVPKLLHEAKLALDRAEAAQKSDPSSPVARDLAYIAGRKAERAMVATNIVLAEQQKMAAQQQTGALRSRTAEATEDELTRTQRELSMNRQQLAIQLGQLREREQRIDDERKARDEAEKRAQAASEALRNVAAVRQEERGVVITLPGSVLFASGQSKLLPDARQRLNQVAEVVKQEAGRKITIEGHCDATGGDDVNQTLSLARAETVREYLASRGVPVDIMDATGYGESRPIADNGSSEGRATNRRVEIVVGQPSPSSEPQKP